MIMVVAVCYVKNMSVTLCQIIEGTISTLLNSQQNLLFVLVHMLAEDEIKTKQGPNSPISP